MTFHFLGLSVQELYTVHFLTSRLAGCSLYSYSGLRRSKPKLNIWQSNHNMIKPAKKKIPRNSKLHAFQNYSQNIEYTNNKEKSRQHFL